MKFRWENEHKIAFELLKQKLAKDIVLKGPDWQIAKQDCKPYHMFTDACDHSIGVVLE